MFSAAITALGNKNDKSFKIKLGSTDKQTYTDAYSKTNQAYAITGASATSSFSVVLEVSDYFTTVTETILVNTAFATMHISEDAKHVAIGQMYDSSRSETLQVNGGIYGTLNGNASTATKATQDSDGNQINSTYAKKTGLVSNTLTATLANTTTDSGWSMIDSAYTGNNGFILRSIRFQQNAPNWSVGNFGAGVCFGGADTKGLISVAYGSPSIKIAGGNGTPIRWWIGMTGTSGRTYDLNNNTRVNLYNNTSGNTGTITLSETSANFAYLEIAFFSQYNNAYFTHRVYSPNGKKTGLRYVEIAGPNSFRSSDFFLFGRDITISGTSISTTNNTYGFTAIDGGYCERENRVYIVRVDGYR